MAAHPNPKPYAATELRTLAQTLLVIAALLGLSQQLHAQLPFYTDDTGLTDRGKWHFEFFNEYDSLQLQYPALTQNTANFKLNYGLPHHLEIDVDVPYLTINRTDGNHDSSGNGDTNLGLKTRFREETPGSRWPSFAASFYIELPTGDSKNQLGSGLADYWLNFIAQKSITPKTRLTGNLGYLFAGNTATGDIGTTTTRGHVFPAGISLLHDFTTRLTLGAEAFGAYTENGDLGKSQLQFMGGGNYQLRQGFSLAFGLLGGKYEASPRLGGQLGFALDIPDLFHPKD